MSRILTYLLALLTMAISSTQVNAQKSVKGSNLSGCLIAFESSGKFPLGSIENTCAFPINFVYCLENIRDGVISAKGCNSRPYEIISISARGTFGSETERGDAYYFACMSPGIPSKLEYVRNQGIRAICVNDVNEEESTAKKRELTPLDKSQTTGLGGSADGNKPNSNNGRIAGTICKPSEDIVNRMIREDVPEQVKRGNKIPETAARENVQGHFNELDWRLSQAKSSEGGETLDKWIATQKLYYDKVNEFHRLRTQGYIEIIDCKLKNGSLKRW